MAILLLIVIFPNPHYNLIINKGMKEIIKEECPSCDVHDYCSLHNPEPLENKEEKCRCEQDTCKEDCTRNHTCHVYWCKKCKPERYTAIEQEAINIDTPQTPEWETKIREDYKGILNQEQIEATIEYWKSLISQAEERGRRRGIEEIRNLIK